MEQKAPKNVSLTITKNGDFTYHGPLGEYEAVAIMEAYRDMSKVQRNHLKMVMLTNWFIDFFGRFSGLFPLVLLLMISSLVLRQCSNTPVHQPQNHQEYRYAR